ncbi:hypothetical protein ACFVUN_34500 [Kitasatospora griseola]|uniref:hypothetical protein n=1 Tax=Kitasatospora griseola TaxID=2064 RepID=UPI0036DA989E
MSGPRLGDDTPADHYASGRYVRLVGVARTHRNLAVPYIAVRQLVPVPAAAWPVEETLLLRYCHGPGEQLSERVLTRCQLDLVVPAVARAAARGHAWSVEVLDAAGVDVTGDVADLAGSRSRAA